MTSRRLVALTAAALACAAGVAWAGGAAKLKLADAEVEGSGGITTLASPSDVAISRDGEFVYVTAFDDSSITVFRRNQSTQKLSFVQAVTDGVDGVDGLAGAQDVLVSPNGRFVYVTAAVDGKLAIFERNANNGRLTFDTVKEDGVGGVDHFGEPTGLATTPDSHFLYVTNNDAAVVIFRVTAAGKHRFVGAAVNGERGVEDMPAPWGMDFSRRGRFAYVASESADSSDGAVVVFRRNPKTGKLRFVQSIADGERGADNLANSFVLDVAPDDRNVYVAAETDDALTVFKRNSRTGKLKFVQDKVDGEGDIEGMERVYDPVVTPDGASVYTAGYADSALVEFARNPRTGRLRLVAEKTDGTVAGGDDLGGVWRLAGDNHGVFLASYDDWALVAFKRTP